MTITECGYVSVNGSTNTPLKAFATDSIRTSYDFGTIYNRVGIQGCLVIEVNGKDAKHMTYSEFYNIIDNADDISLKVLGAGERQIKKVKIVKVPYSQEYLDYDITIDDIINTTDDVSFGRSVTSNFANLKENEKKFGATINQLTDPDFDWFYVKTYDFLITGNDPLNDKKILENLYLPGHWKRDTENPDILITIAKNADESISSTYVPPSSRTVNTGSLTTSRYNYLTKRNEYTTQQYNTTIREGGYTQTTKSINIFLEFAALDAKRLDEQTPPIIWQMTYRRYVVNPTFNPFSEYQEVAKSVLLPFDDRIGTTTIKHYYCKGMKMSGNGKVVTFVKEGGYAYNMGFRAGDYIIKCKCRSNGSTYSYFKPNQYNRGRELTFTVRRNGKNITLKGEPVAESPELYFTYLIDKP